MNSSNSSAKVHPAASARTFWVMGDQVSKRGKLDGTEFNIVDVMIPPGSGTPPHTHASPEIFRILQGTVRIWSLSDGKPVETDAVAGDVVTIPAHAPHAYRNVSPLPALMMSVVDDQMVGFFEAAASDEPLAGPPTPEAIGRIVALTATHGINVLQAA
ncbi:MAG: cupin domain-containing protein [Rhizobiaceae bacterium]|nr:cupin domain-containing protein [Rhizobiaceae bacterium]